jgi:hypothetical protein
LIRSSIFSFEPKGKLAAAPFLVWGILPLLPLLMAGIAIWQLLGVDLVRWPGLERLVISRDIARHESNYLRDMRDTHLGCNTLQYRPADIVFIGDSHSYAGYDYLLLQQALRPLIVGNCAYAGMAPENVLHFLAVAKTAGLLPRYLVFGISPDMFWEDEERRSLRIPRTQREIGKLAGSRETLFSVLSGRYRVIDDFHDDSPGQRIEVFNRGIETLSDQVIARFFEAYASGIHELDYWIDAVRKGRLDGRSLATIEPICAAARQLGIDLGVVYIPESAWLVSRLTREQKAGFEQVMRRFAACADWVDFTFFSAGGGQNRWFVDRFELPDYPYDAWADPAAARRWQEEAPRARQWKLFDPDHMNPLGAREFSRHVGAVLKSHIGTD